MRTLTGDARGFIEGITQYIQKEGKPSLFLKVQTLLGKIASQGQKETAAVAVSSVPLTDEERQRVERFLYRLIGHPVSLTTSVDSHLLGGLTIHIGDWIVDTSLSGQLTEMAQDILQ